MSFITPRDGWEDPPPTPPPQLQPFVQAGTPVQYVYAAVQPQYRTSYLTCKVCDRGALTPKKIFRMSPPVVVIGFILLIPCVLGILASILFFFGTVSCTTAVPRLMKREALANMNRASVPRGVIRAVTSGDALTVSEWLASDVPLSFQRDAVQQAEVAFGTSTAAASGLGILLGGFSFFTAIMSFVGGLLGWLLVMRKRVLQCGLCGAVINAS